jgi:hypothetical protein
VKRNPVLGNRSSSQSARLPKTGSSAKKNGAKKKREPQPKQILESRHGNDGRHAITYQLELVRCGKARCERWHGPYWYAYWKTGGRTKKRYIGKHFRELVPIPAELAAQRAADEASVIAKRLRAWEN